MSKRATRTAPKERMSNESIGCMLSRALGKQKRSQRKPQMHSRSLAPAAINRYEHAMEAGGLTPEEIVEHEEFFDIATSTSVQGYPVWTPPPKDGKQMLLERRQHAYHQRAEAQSGKRGSKQIGFAVKRSREATVARRPPKENDDDDDDDNLLENIEDFFTNSDRKQSGMGCVAKIFGGAKPNTDKNWRPKRPFFTLWVTIIQLVVYIISMCIYGIAPIGVSSSEVTDEVLMTSLAIEQVSYFESDNMWIGPRNDDLIHIGAKYSPCMRVDENMEDVIEQDNEAVQDTACCVRNDGGGCFQAAEDDCSGALTTWFKWTDANPGPDNRTSGSVCGNSPEYCLDPLSVGDNVWPDNITEWPNCREMDASTGTSYWASCEVIGRPCCVGIQAECIVATREYCDFRRGYFHEEATLCSQVDCLDDVCGMTPFVEAGVPDQFYRLFVSLFLHAGLLTMLLTLLMQFTIMYELERLIGWLQMTILYIGSGIAGTLGSCIFLPYSVEAGPSGSQFGFIAAMFVEILRWNQYDNPCKTILKLTFVLILLFLVGLLPSIDNYAHVFGFLFGLLICIGMRPFKSACKKEIGKTGRIIFGVVCFIVAVVMFAILTVVFYFYPFYDCEYCMYFNCIPITDTFCESSTVVISRSS